MRDHDHDFQVIRSTGAADWSTGLYPTDKWLLSEATPRAGRVTRGAQLARDDPALQPTAVRAGRARGVRGAAHVA
jgi:hypothetical protein